MTMTDQEVIVGTEQWGRTLEDLKVFLTALTGQPVVKNMFAHSVAGFLITAVDYLQTNLDEIANRVRMS